MIKSKYNWPALKRKYINGRYVSGKYKSLKDFADQEKLPYETIKHKGSKWHNSGKKVEKKVEEKTIDDAADVLIARNKADLENLDAVVAKGMESIKRWGIRREDAVRAVISGTEVAREIIVPGGKDNKVHLIISKESESTLGRFKDKQ